MSAAYPKKYLNIIMILLHCIRIVKDSIENLILFFHKNESRYHFQY